MAARIKGKLKAAREALGKKDFAVAKDAALQVLDDDPENYNARVFLGLSCLELGELENSEQAYKKAIDTNPQQVLAWQGLSKFYERSSHWDKYGETLIHLVNMYASSDDPIKCAESLQKLIEGRRKEGSRAQVIEALSLLLPGSPIYPVISNLPTPDPTNPIATTTLFVQSATQDSLPILEEIVALVEKDEDETVNKEIQKRRTRLGASGPEQLKKEVSREVLGESKLPNLYNEIMNHPSASDALRREAESKLIQHQQRYLHALPASPTKTGLLNELEDLVNGVVLLGIPNELAWTIHLEGKNYDTIEGFDFTFLRQMIDLFPDRPLTLLLKTYFAYMGIPLSSDEELLPEPNREAYDAILDIFPSTSELIFANLIVAEVSLNEVDYETSIKVSEGGLEHTRKSEVNTGKKLDQVQKAFNVALATSLVHLYPPKHHARALQIIDQVLEVDGDNTACLMGRAYILQHSKNWDGASKLFARVAERMPDDMGLGLRGKEEHAWCLSNAGSADDAIQSLRAVADTLEGLDGRDIDQARCLWRMGICCWEMSEDKYEDAYSYFIASLKCSPTYAPAFTSLGVYYAEALIPPDLTRASKCFQKAFELDAREADAARRLAESFAADMEWDLVEIVARRTIDGEGGLDAGIENPNEVVAINKFLPTNAWAWKALGVVEIVRDNFLPAIQAFQTALRADQNDRISWLRLGEAYSKAGRHAAALKALSRARELDPHDWMCIYLIGDIQRQTGQFQEALDSFESVLTQRPSEIGALLSLAQTHLDLGRTEISTGFIARSERSFVACIHVSLQMVQNSAGFRAPAWKTIGDAVFALSQQSQFVDERNVREALSTILSLATNPSERVAGLLSITTLDATRSLTGITVLEVAVIAFDHCLSLGSAHHAGSTLFDLGVALHVWSARHPPSETKLKAEKQALQCIMDAMREDPRNDVVWTMLGNFYFTQQPKVAQHAYIKALELDSKNVVTWTNLGLFYSYHGDFKLANEALSRAQTLDPDYTLAWVAQGLVARSIGRSGEATALFEHAVSLKADAPEADLEFASRIFGKRAAGSASNADRLLPAFFALDRYCQRRPNDACALHLLALICERLGHVERASSLLRRCTSLLESEYEESEDATIEWQFVVANASLARINLSQKDWAGALEIWQNVLGLLGDGNDEEGERKAQKTVLQVQARFAMALANFELGDIEGAVGMFQEALALAGETPQLDLHGNVAVLSSKLLWAVGSEEGRESAKAQLLECITNDPENLAAITTLAGMGILTDDESLIDAALSEIESLPPELRRERDPGRDSEYLLTRYHLAQGEVHKAQTILQRAIHLQPSHRPTWLLLAELLVQCKSFEAACALLMPSQLEQGVEEGEACLCAVALMATGHSERGLAVVKKAVMLRPWDQRLRKVLMVAQKLVHRGGNSGIINPH